MVGDLSPKPEITSYKEETIALATLFALSLAICLILVFLLYKKVKVDQIN